MNIWNEVRSIKKTLSGVASHNDIINLERNNTKFINPKILLTIQSLELEGNTQRIFCQAVNISNNVYKIIACATTTTDIDKIEDEFVSTKYGTVVWMAFESD